MKNFFAFLLLTTSLTAQIKIAGSTKNAGTVTIGGNLVDSTPPMGLNSFYAMYEENPTTWQPTETWMKASADSMVSTGLAALGFKYVSMDDGWSQRVGGVLQCIPAQFPSGCAALTAYIQSKGLLAGIYSSPNTTTCGGYPGSLGTETTDANTFASWGFVYVKYDACPTGTQAQFQAMGSALQARGRFSYLVNTSSGTITSYAWYQTVGGTANRSIGDIGSSSMDARLYGIDWNFYRTYQNKGHWIDPDYLMCDLTINPITGGGTLVTDAQCQTQFTHYAILAAPLIIATDLSTITANSLATYSNSEVIAVDQDSLGVMGLRISQTTCGSTFCEVWLRQLHDGYAVELVNRDTGASHNISTTWAALGIAAGTWNIRDLIAHASAGSSSTGYTATAVGPYRAALVKLTP